ncbi:MAG: tetratricopeptide repeat protein [Candidatus Auribacter fodinae]|jgi:tetratricopeptide (TPR) repeat protein|uniref:Tetratricopeptide repeat protein n=1 Tax=Candidatus Auribacter fodinae TaxID=2093366 RepID=A0A3A4QQF4_9BACT|nr:MAG: tetratricopeptide repeat protein [Candidatus Auribacter fodinae]
MKRFLPIILIIVASLLSYSNIFRNEFVFDDPDVILKNEAIKDITNLKAIVTTNYWHSEANAGLYRPFIFLTYAIDYHFWKDNPVGYHFFNIIGNLGSGIVLYLIFALLLNNPISALLSALLFVIHPLHTEAVTGIVGRAEVYAAFFFFLAWYWYLRGYQKGYFNVAMMQYCLFSNYAIGSYIAFFLALCSKENSVVLPVILASSTLVFGREFSVVRSRNILVSLVPYILVFFAYMLIRMSVIGSIGPQGEEQFFHGKPFTTVLFTMSTVFIYYLKLLFLPTGLLGVYRHWPMYASFFDIRVIFSMIILSCAAICSVLYLLQKKTWQFFVFFFVVTLFPVSNLVIRIGDIMAERFLYLPSAGYCALVGFFCSSLLRRYPGKIRLLLPRRVMLVSVSILFVSLIVLTVARNAVWRNGIVFWHETLKHIPDSFPGYYNLAVAYSEKQQYNRAIQALQKSLDLHPRHHLARRYLAELYYDIGNYEEAIKQNALLLQYQPTEGVVYSNFALCYFKQRKYDQALAVAERGLKHAHDKTPVYHVMMRIYKNENDYENALKTAYKAVEYNPDDIKAYLNMGTYYERMEDFVLAKESFRNVIKRDPKNLEALDKLASIYFKEENYRDAIAIWRNATKWYPSAESFWYYIGLAYDRMDQHELAVKSWRNIKESSEYKKRIQERLQ